MEQSSKAAVLSQYAFLDAAILSEGTSAGIQAIPQGIARTVTIFDPLASAFSFLTFLIQRGQFHLCKSRQDPAVRLFQ
jgi:hypothetical protein